jgi:rhodanese-related sulfurtransferase
MIFSFNLRKSKIMQEYIDFLSNNPMLSLAWVAIAVMLIHSLVKDKISGVKSITAQEATLLINKQDAIVVDVRSKDDFQNGHIVNAKNITLSQIEKGNFSAIENNKQTPIIVVCESGTRSASAAAKLVKAEFTQVTNLFSGMGGWKSANLPTTKK